MSAVPFEFEVPISFFEKADAPKGTQRRHGGIISTETEDQQGETVLAEGLDLEPFKQNGWFNDNHEKSTTGIVGYPDPKSVKRVKKGDKLPDGTISKSNGVWAEGYLLNTSRADEIWKIAQELKATGRSLGYSVEGSVIKRDGPQTVIKKGRDGSVQLVGNRVVQARVNNVAITGCPVQSDSRLSILAKSLQAMADEEAELGKSLTMGTPAVPGDAPVGPVTGEGAGQVVTPESLEGGRGRKAKKKKLTDAEAIVEVQKSVPGIDVMNAARIVEITKQLKRSGRL